VEVETSLNGGVPSGLASLMERLVQCAADVNWRVLQPHFGRYEAAAGVAEADERFRWGIAVALAKYMISLMIEGTASERRRQRSAQLRTLATQEREAKRVWDAIGKLTLAPRANSNLHARTRTIAFQTWAGASLVLADARRRHLPRGRPYKIADELFLCEMATLYHRATGRGPTVVENQAEDDPYAGKFVALIREVQGDAREIFKKVDAALPSQMSAAIARYAKGLRLNRKISGNLGPKTSHL
jgi:hypothetical protein